MLHKKRLLAIVLLVAGLLLVGGCKAQDPIVGTWAFKGTAPKTANPESATYTSPKATGTVTQKFLANGTYVDDRGASHPWKRVDSNTVDVAGVTLTVTVKGNDLYETLGSSTLHWVKTQ